jgi:hypothetical protein
MYFFFHVVQETSKLMFGGKTLNSNFIWGKLIERKHGGIFHAYKYIPYIDWNEIYMDINICQNSLNLKKFVHIFKLFLNFNKLKFKSRPKKMNGSIKWILLWGVQVKKRRAKGEGDWGV